MSEHASPPVTTGDSVTLETGLEAFQSSAEFGGPVEDLEGHQCNDHFAQIYETDAERFAAAVPFVRHGLDRDERVMYVIDESSEAEVMAALRDAGLDSETALDTGQLSFHTVQDTYLRNGSFEPDEMIDFYADTVAEATAEYDALRIVAETTWLQDDTTTVEQFMEYESKVNDLFADENALAICQYDRDGFPPEMIRDIIQTHPHLIYDDAVCHNFYYTPPAEFFGNDDPARENDRMLRTLRERTAAKAELQQRDRFLQNLYDVTANQDRSFEAKLDALFELGCEQFDLDFGFLNRVDDDADQLKIEYATADHEPYKVGGELPLSETYCQDAVDIKTAASIPDPVEEGFDDRLVYEEFGVEGYLGTYIPVKGGSDRTLAFVPADDTETVSVSEEDRTYLELMAQWIGYELERRQRERELERTKTRFETVFEQSTDGIFLLDPDADELVAANPAAAEMVGYAHDDLLSRSPSDLHPDELERFHAFLEEVQETGSAWSEDLHCRHKNGHDIPAEITASAITLDGRDLVLMNVRHIDERKQHERYQRDLTDIVADTQASFDEKLEHLLELGRERFGLEIGYFTRTSDDEEFEIVEAVGDHDQIKRGVTGSLCDTYCEKLLASPGSISVADVAEVGWTDDPAHERFGLDAYFAVTIHVGGDEYGTLSFASETPQQKAFTEAEQTFLDLMGQCLEYELERRRRERFLRESLEITADPDHEFETKLERLLDLGRDWFGLEMAGLNHLPSWDGKFRLEKGVGLDVDPADKPLWTNPGDGCFCRQTLTAEEPVGMSDVRETDWEDDQIHREFGLTSYLGTKVTSGTTRYGTLWFGSTQPCDREFTATEKTFLELIGQWASYEIERREHNEAERDLYEIAAAPDLGFEEKLDALFDLGKEQFGLDTGGMVKVYPEADKLEVEHVSDDRGGFEPGLEPPLSGTYCGAAYGADEAVTITDPAEAGYDDGYAYQELGFEAYLGTHIKIEDGRDRLFFFTTAKPRDGGFSDAERTFIELLGQWVKYELERRQRERELEQVERQFEATFNNPSSFMGLLDPDGTVQRINETALEFAGIDEADVRGEQFWETPWFAHSEELQEEVRTKIARAADGEYVRAEFAHHSPDGEAVIVDAMLEPVRDEDGEVVAIVPSGNDITELKEHKERLKQKSDRLESFASMLAHELRNPVAIGQIYSQQLPDEADAEAIEYVTDAFDRIENMVDVLLILTRGREAIGDRTPVDLADVVHKAWDTVEALNAVLDVELDQTIEADETYTRHLFRNLLENAVEHGGSDVTIRVGNLDDGFYVADDGEGISPEDRGAVFDEGYTTTADNGGTGLGLAFVQKLAEVYEWDITVTDSADGGARFEFRDLA